METTPTTEERVWAVLSHLSVLALGMGIILPIIGWSEQRRKSNYASFQCLQALGYQSLGYTVWLLFYLVILMFSMVLFVFAIDSAGNNSDAITVWTGSLLFIIFGLLGLYLVLPVVAAVACALGRDFQYPIMGKRLARYLNYQSSNETNEPPALNEEHENRWVAAMGHFTVIIALWGLVAPLTSWILQGRQSAFLKFQSIQTTIFQAIVNAFYMGAAFMYLIAAVPLFLMTSLSGDVDPGSSMGLAGLVLLFVFLIVASLVLLLLPFFHILGQWAGYRVLKGHDYHYPVIGRLVEKRLAGKNPLGFKGETS
jgi:uncharacterized Tic20 family protein